MRSLELIGHGQKDLAGQKTFENVKFCRVRPGLPWGLNFGPAMSMELEAGLGTLSTFDPI